MEICIVTEKYLNIIMFGHKHMLSREGGIEIVVKELAIRMAERGHKVVCFDRKTHHVSGSELKEKRKYKGVKIVPVWTVDCKGLAAVTSSFAAAWKAIKSKADIIHIHAEGPALMCWVLKMKGKRVIVTIHGLDWQRAKWGCIAGWYIKAGEKVAAKWADEIIVLSHSTKEYFKSTYNRNTTFIPNGVSKPVIREASEIIRRWGLDKDSYVLFSGRIVPEKGLLYLIEAWEKVTTDKKLVIVGGSSDTQKFMDELKEISGENIIFTGFQQGRILEELYSNAYIYALPSDLEGMPLSLLEAMSYGNCCVVSNIAECIEVVGDKAVSFSHGNAGELRMVLQKLLDEPEQVQKYKAGAAEYIFSKYNWDYVVEQTLELYRR